MICTRCQSPFEPTRPHQRFCGRKCRNDWHNAGDGSLLGKVNGMRELKGGDRVVTVRVPKDVPSSALTGLLGSVVDLVRHGEVR